MRNRILILTDHCGYTATSLTRGISNSIDVIKLKKFLEEMGNDVQVCSLHDVSTMQFDAGTFVYYPSSEDVGLFYKSFISDVLLYLESSKLVLLPKYKYFAAHHDKVLMELLRNTLKSDTVKSVQSIPVYDMRDLKDKKCLIEETIKYPAVIKMASGSGASGVSLAKNWEELHGKVRKMGKINYRNFSMPWHSTVTLSKMKSMFSRIIGQDYVERTYPREKMIIQTFIPNLQYDYKVLVYGKRFYLLKRLIRTNDFRASGSGKLIFPSELNQETKMVLDTARLLFKELNVPLLSVDIAFDGQQCYIIEFQCVSFGPYTLQFSKEYYTFGDNDGWCMILAESDLEKEIANALELYIRESQGMSNGYN